ncbi:hypothetical protein EVA_00443, partial [gut metagenome]
GTWNLIHNWQTMHFSKKSQGQEKIENKILT